jgi:hypothetical protein
MWTPIPLRTLFWVTYVCVLVAGAITLEVALHYSHKKGGTSLVFWIENHIRLLILRSGWPIHANVEKGILHFVYVRRCLDEKGPLFTGPSLVRIDSPRGRGGYDSGWPLDMDRPRSQALASEPLPRNCDC